MRLPVDLIDLLRIGLQFQKEREKPLRIAVFVELDAPDVLIEAIRERMRPRSSGARLHIEVTEPDATLVIEPSVDAVIGLAGSGSSEFRASLAEARKRAVPTVVLALAADNDNVARLLEHPVLDTLSCQDDLDQLVEVELGEWLITHLRDKRLALAHNFAFMRRVVALESVKNTALQNALIGGIAIVPGADMPLMTANQAKMVLQIAAAYGERLDTKRLRELLGVVGGAFALRTAARQVVGLLPGFGWAVKGGIGYLGTLAMGYAAITYFEGGVDVEGLRRRFDELRIWLAERKGSRFEGVRGQLPPGDSPSVGSSGEEFSPKEPSSGV